jgi:4'-phosphopantetheinyl transferase
MRTLLWQPAKGWVSPVPVSLEPQVKFNLREFTAWSAVSSLDLPARDEVHAWYAIGNSATCDAASVEQYLSEEEKIRSARLRFEEHRKHFVLSHAMLRLLISSYCAMNPRDVSFSLGLHGKPSIDRSLGLTFNLSHAEDGILCAFANQRQIGADIERVRVNFNVEEIGERFFSLAERGALRGLATAQKHAAFFRLWTRKEAYIKARGEGLSHPLHQFDISLADTGNVLMSTRPNAEEANRWIVWNVTVPRGYVAAVAFEAGAAREDGGGVCQAPVSR